MPFFLLRLTIFYAAYRQKIKHSFILILVLSVGFFAIDVPRWADGEKHFFALNVGQGDALLFRSATGKNVLIDGGPDNTVLEELGAVLPFFDRTLEYVILTHPDADHLTGLLNILQRYTVKHLLITGVAKKTAVYKKFFTIIEQENIPVTFVKAPLSFNVDEISFTVLWPIETLIAQESEPVNDTSITLRVDVEETSFLLTGDFSDNVEKQLIERYGTLLDVDILKAPHHGSKTSSSASFLEIVTPETVVISVGKENRYGHPTAEALERIKSVGATIRRTDQEGRIELIF